MFHVGAMASLGLRELALWKVHVARLRVMASLVEMLNRRLKFVDAFAVVGAGQFEAARSGRRRVINSFSSA